MNSPKRVFLLLLLLLAACGGPAPMLAEGVAPGGPAREDWRDLPLMKTETAVVFRGGEGAAFNIHNYLHHDGERFRIMWSSSPRDEGEAGTRVREAVSDDGLTWRETGFIGVAAGAGERDFARGYWQRTDGLVALASRDKAGPYFGPDLKMLAYRADPSGWQGPQAILPGLITNFPPQRLADGAWLESVRDTQMRPGFARGGKRLDDWSIAMLPKPPTRIDWVLWPRTVKEKRPKGEAWKSLLRIPLPTLVAPKLGEPVWWVLPDGRLLAVFRDDSYGGQVYRSFAGPDGRSWSPPERTNFPDATSKLAALRLSNGLYVLISNARPYARERNPLVLSVSRDGVTFRAMALLKQAPTERRVFGDRKTPGYQYPHAMEVDGWLYVAYSRNKEDIEVLRLRVSTVADLMR